MFSCPGGSVLQGSAFGQADGRCQESGVRNRGSRKIPREIQEDFVGGVNNHREIIEGAEGVEDFAHVVGEKRGGGKDGKETLNAE